MKQSWFGLLLAFLVPAAALAQQPPATAWTQFTDPTENAFGAEVPQGWTVKGGVTRFSPLVAMGWLTATSLDGRTQVFVGDPSLPNFVVPRGNQAEGVVVPPPNAIVKPNITLNYRPGAEFAKAYGPIGLAAANCTSAALTGIQPMPDAAQMAVNRTNDADQGLGLAPAQADAGLAQFTCQNAGRSLSAGVIATTSVPTAFGSFWNVGVSGYITQPGQEAAALAVLNHIIASEQWNPQWDQAMREEFKKSVTELIQTNQRIGQEMMAQLTKQEKTESDMLRGQANANQAALTAGHNTFMAQMGQQSAARNAQFKTDMAAKGLNAWKFNAYVRNGNVYRNAQTGQYFEVDH